MKFVLTNPSTVVFEPINFWAEKISKTNPFGNIKIEESIKSIKAAKYQNYQEVLEIRCLQSIKV